MSIHFWGLVSNIVPGAIAADVYKPGDVKAIVCGAAATAATTEWIKMDDSPLQKHIRALYRERPMIATGAGYLVARMSGFDPAKSLLAGASAAVVMVAICPKILTTTGADNTTDQNSGIYTAVPEEGPSAPPAAIDKDLLY